VFAPITIFWALFDQTSSTWVLQGDKMLAFRFADAGFIRRLLPNWGVISGVVGFSIFLVLLYLVFIKFAHFVSRSSLWIRVGFFVTSAVVAGLLGRACLYLPNFRIGAEQMQSMNPLFVMMLVPLTLWLYPRFEKAAGIRVSPLRRMGVGMFLAALAYVVVGFCRRAWTRVCR
jgi:dipeptide/tripeptide permease